MKTQKKTSKNNPKVSVCVVTYNQEKYVRKCLQSIVDQERNFEIEIIIADDCSTDGTIEILLEFKEKYPHLIKLHLHPKNIGPYKNFHFVHQQATGEYISHIDGDDYCLPSKLQKQVDILDSDNECNIVWHRVLLENPDGFLSESGPDSNSDFIKSKFDRGNILQYMAIGVNSSKMYRKSVRDFPLPEFELIDYFANVEQIQDGHARFTGPEPLGVYRLGIGIASQGTKTREILAKCFIYFLKKYPKYKSQINTACLTYALSDFKNRKGTWKIFLLIWLKELDLKSIINLPKHLINTRMLSKNI